MAKFKKYLNESFKIPAISLKIFDLDMLETYIKDNIDKLKEIKPYFKPKAEYDDIYIEDCPQEILNNVGLIKPILQKMEKKTKPHGASITFDDNLVSFNGSEG